MLTDDEVDAITQEHMRTTCAPDCEILHREVRSLLARSIKWSYGRRIIKFKVEGGPERTLPPTARHFWRAPFSRTRHRRCTLTGRQRHYGVHLIFGFILPNQSNTA
jgi:hypothetical protein